MANELEKNQPTEMIVLPKGEYDLLRERAVSGYYDDEIDLIDLMLIPVKRWQVLAGTIIVGLFLGVSLFFWKKNKSALELSLDFQSGEVYSIGGVTKTFSPKSVYDQLYLKKNLTKIANDLAYGAYQVKTVALSKKKSETQVQFFKEQIDNIKGPDIWFTMEVELSQPDLDIYEIKLYLHNSKSQDILNTLNRELMRNTLKKQQEVVALNEEEFANYKKEYLELLRFDLTKDQSGVIFNRIKELASFLEQYELFIPRSSAVLNMEDIKPKRVSILFLVLPVIAMSFLAFFLTFVLEFLQKANLGDRLKSLKNL